MHRTQIKILNLAQTQEIAGLTLRAIGELIGETEQPQRIKHHITKLIEKGLLQSGSLRPFNIREKTEDKIISLPIYGSANCGIALELANNHLEGYLKISKKILSSGSLKRIKNLFVLKAVGDSMNKAKINNKNIEEGDYIIVDQEDKIPNNNDYIVSVINGAGNIKKIHIDNVNRIIILMSESSKDIPPIYIHEDDFHEYLICGKVVDVIKKPRIGK